MALPTAYLTSTKNVEGIFNAIQSAKAPPTFTQRFLEDLGFKGNADRLIVNVLKALGFLSADGTAYAASIGDSVLAGGREDGREVTRDLPRQAPPAVSVARGGIGRLCQRIVERQQEEVEAVGDAGRILRPQELQGRAAVLQQLLAGLGDGGD